MSKRIQKKSVLLASLAVGLVCGSALAATQHSGMVLRDRAGAPITPTSANNAFSMQGTCSACHNGSTNGGTTPLLSSYAQIEQHNYHAQVGANEFRGFNPWNADSSDAFRRAVGPQGKNWVQSPGHFGSW